MGNSGSSALHSASLSGDAGALRKHIAHVDDLRIAPLHAAALGGHEECVRLLMNAPGILLDRRVVLGPALFPGVDDENNPFPNSLMTPLACAILNGSLGIVKLLVADGASLESIEECPSPLSMAICSHADVDILEYLLDSGANTGGGADFLMLACLYGNVEAMDALYARGVTTDMNGALSIVVSKSYRTKIADVPRVVAWLIDHGADVRRTYRIMDRLVECGCTQTFDIVVGAFRNLMRR